MTPRHLLHAVRILLHTQKFILKKRKKNPTSKRDNLQSRCRDHHGLEFLFFVFAIWADHNRVFGVALFGDVNAVCVELVDVDAIACDELRECLRRLWL